MDVLAIIVSSKHNCLPINIVFHLERLLSTKWLMIITCARGWQKSFMAIKLKVKTKSEQSVKVILVLILNEALKMKIVKQKI